MLFFFFDSLVTSFFSLHNVVGAGASDNEFDVNIDSGEEFGCDHVNGDGDGDGAADGAFFSFANIRTIFVREDPNATTVCALLELEIATPCESISEFPRL